MLGTKIALPVLRTHVRCHIAPRLNRLPQRLDYTLIPAPLGELLWLNTKYVFFIMLSFVDCVATDLDLTLPLVDEKAPLPAIIVTPSSPSGETDFSIAFIAPPPKPTLQERLSSILPNLSALRSILPSQVRLPTSPLKTSFQEHTSSTWSVKARTRSTLLLILLLFIMGCHLVMHRLATGRPHLEFGGVPDEDTLMIGTLGSMDNTGSVPSSAMGTSKSHRIGGGWIKMHSPFDPSADADGKRAPNFVIWEDDYVTP